MWSVFFTQDVTLRKSMVLALSFNDSVNTDVKFDLHHYSYATWGYQNSVNKTEGVDKGEGCSTISDKEKGFCTSKI